MNVFFNLSLYFCLPKNLFFKISYRIVFIFDHSVTFLYFLFLIPYIQGFLRTYSNVSKSMSHSVIVKGFVASKSVKSINVEIILVGAHALSCFAGNNGGLSLKHLVSLCDAPLTLFPGFCLGSRTYMSTDV